jgi:protein ImuB
VEHSKPRTKNALESLAGWAEQFSSWVCYDTDRCLLWMEVGTGLKYFGGLDVIRSRVEHGLVQLGYLGGCGIAPTLEAAAALSLVPGALPLPQATDLAAALAQLPIAALHLDDDVADTLAELGLRTIGQVLALPRDTVARRFDSGLIDYVDRLTGARPDPRKPYRSPARYRRKFELLGNVETTEGLLFPLRRILAEFQGYLVGRDIAVQELVLQLGHDSTDPTYLQVRSSRPVRDGLRLFALVRDRLERTTLVSPVEAITVAADHFVPLGDAQFELIDGGERNDRDWQDLLDTLRARLGEEAVGQLSLWDEHRPERAWRLSEGPQKPPEKPFPERPFWLLEPRRLNRLPKVVSRPERIEAGWWDGEDQQRDYFTVETENGARLWVYRDGAAGAWFVHGIWA